MHKIKTVKNEGVVSRRPLNQQVYEILRESILSGKIAEDTKLNEVDIAQSLNVSPTPVREAFRRLAMENLVIIEPWKGVIVKGYSGEEIREIYQCRESLEGMAARLAAMHMDDSAMRSLVTIVEKCAEANDLAAVVESNRQLHESVLKGSGNRKLGSMLQVIQELIWRDMSVTAEDLTRRKAILFEHQAIVEAIKARDAEAAESAMRLHVRNGFIFRYKRQLL